MTAQQVAITATPDNGILAEGDNLIIECNATSLPTSPSLMLNGETADPANIDRLAVDISGSMSTFNYSAVTPDDNGFTFACTAQGLTPSDEVILTVLCEYISH